MTSLQILALICLMAVRTGADALPEVEVVRLTTAAPKVTTAAPPKATSAALLVTAPAPMATTAAPKMTTAAVQKPTTMAQPLTISKLSGEMIMDVSDVASFSSDPRIATICQETLATCVGLPAVDVRILSLDAVQQHLASASGERRLAAGSVKVNYEIMDTSNTLLPAVVATTGSAMQYEANLALREARMQGSIMKVTFSAIPAQVDVPMATTASPTALPAQGNPCKVATVTPSVKSSIKLPSQLTNAVETVKKVSLKSSEQLEKSMEAVKKASLKSAEQLDKSIKAMPSWQKKAGIAAASVAGAAAVAGGIAGLVESQATPAPPSSKIETVKVPVKVEVPVPRPSFQREPSPQVVAVQVPVKVEVPVAGTVSVLYDDAIKTQASGAVASDSTTLTNVAMFTWLPLSVAGCLFMAASGLVYCRSSQRKRASEIHAFAELPAAEVP